VKVIHGQINRLCACCQKRKKTPPSSQEEREPIIAASDSPVVGRKHLQRRATHASGLSLNNGDTVQFWVPEIQHVQPGNVQLIKLYDDYREKVNHASTDSELMLSMRMNFYRSNKPQA